MGNTKEQLKRLYNNDLPFDLTVESFVATLINRINELNHINNDSDPALDQTLFFVEPQGSAQRIISDEIKAREIKNPLDEKKPSSYYLSINREGIYHTLPPKIFAPPDHKENKDYLSPLRFFQPFEFAAYQARIAIELWEQKVLKVLPDSLSGFWNLQSGKTESGDLILNAAQERALFYLLPLAHRITGNFKLTEECFSAILQKKVLLKHLAPPTHLSQETLPNLGAAILGDDFILGDKFTDGIPAVEVQIFEVLPMELDSFLLEEGKNYQILENILFPYFLPLELVRKTVIFTEKDDEDFSLSASGHTSILGYTTNL